MGDLKRGHHVLKGLKLGQSPWDSFSREELLLEVWRLHAALIEARSALDIIKHNTPNIPFWSEDGLLGGGHAGLGGDALRRANAALSPVDDKAYGVFFSRVTDDLLFPELPKEGWVVCPKCGHSFACPGGTPPNECVGCKTPLRPICWDDVRKDW